ncbi:MAG: amidohydrolase [Deltaproteobacteria bacterium]|nr:MAG: amidohydrolase [Deltaproteobacteria bacterium]
MIDAHSHLGVYATPGVDAHSDGNEATAPITAEVNALHSFWPQDPGLQRASAGGVTTIHVLPGSANLVGGRSVTLRVRRGAMAASDLLFPGAPEGVKMACGENPKRVYGSRNRSPATRMGNVAVLRQALYDARTTLRELEAHEEELRTWCEDGARGDAPEPPARNLQRETLARLLRGELLPQVHCYRADEMRVMLDLAEEFGFSIRAFHHAVEAYKIADELAVREVATATWADWWGFKLEALDAVLENAALLTVAGARAVIHSDSAYDIQRLNQEAAKAYFAGLAAGLELTEDDALRWITANAAWVLGIDHLTGRLAPGLRADVVLWSQHPFSVYARADYVFVDGIAQTVRGEAEHPWSDFELGQWPNEVQP